MKIRNEVARGARHGDSGAPAQMIRVKKSSRAIIGTNPGEPGNPWKHSGHPRFKFGAPNSGIIPVTRLENHRRAARATALEIHSAPSTDVNETGKIGGRGDWSVTLRHVLWRRLLRFLLCSNAKNCRQSQRCGFSRSDQTSDWHINPGTNCSASSLRSNCRREIDDVEIKRELALARFGLSYPSLAPIACQLGRGLEGGDVYLSGKIKGID